MGSLGLSVTADMAPLFEGVLNGQISQYSLENVKRNFSCCCFYPGDWSAESELLLSCFSAEHSGLVSTDCLVYGVSTDSVHAHQEWLAASHLSPAFPLISDPAAVLAHKYGTYSAEEEDEEDRKVVELPPCKCVVITDNQSVMLELVNTSLALEELVTYTQERLNMLLQKRRLAVDRARNRDRIDEADQIRIQRKLGDMSSLSASLVRQSRDRSDSRGRSMGRSLSRSGRDRVRLPQQTKDPLFEHQLKRTVDRLVKGFF